MIQVKVGPSFEESIKIDETPKSTDLEISNMKNLMKFEFKDKKIKRTPHQNQCKNQCVNKWGRRTLEGSLRKNCAPPFQRWSNTDRNDFNLSVIENCRDFKVKLLSAGDYLTADMDVENIADLNDKCHFKDRRCLQREQSSNNVKDKYLLTL